MPSDDMLPYVAERCHYYSPAISAFQVQYRARDGRRQRCFSSRMLVGTASRGFCAVAGLRRAARLPTAAVILDFSNIDGGLREDAMKKLPEDGGISTCCALKAHA